MFDNLYPLMSSNPENVSEAVLKSFSVRDEKYELSETLMESTDLTLHGITLDGIETPRILRFQFFKFPVI